LDELEERGFVEGAVRDEYRFMVDLELLEELGEEVLDEVGAGAPLLLTEVR
jgi:hypothetical protein